MDNPLEEMWGMMAELAPDEQVAVLQGLPFPPEMKVMIGLAKLDDDCDALQLLKPLNDECPRSSAERRMFEHIMNTPQAEIDETVADEQRKGNLSYLDASSTPAQRKRALLTGVLRQMSMMREEGEVMYAANSDDEDEEDLDFPRAWAPQGLDFLSKPLPEHHVPDAQKKPAVRKFESVLKSFEGEALKTMSFETPADEDGSPDLITRDTLLAKRHLLLPDEVVITARKYSRAASEMIHEWMGGGTSLGNALWARFFQPAVAAALADARAGEYQAAMGHLLGLLLIGINDDTWLQDNEVYCDWSEFSLFFTELSRAWASVLAQPDAVLGLAPSTGKIGGYRAALIEKIDDWQNDVNEMLADRYDEFEEDGMEARLKCTAGGW